MDETGAIDGSNRTTYKTCLQLSIESQKIAD